MRFVTGYLLPFLTVVSLGIGVLSLKDGDAVARMYGRQIEQLRATQKATGDRISREIIKRAAAVTPLPAPQ